MWYKYIGRVPVPVKLTDGRVVSVPPDSMVECEPQAVRRYGSTMVRKGPPLSMEGASVPQQDAEPARPAVRVGESPLAGAVQELGAVRAPSDVPPAPTPGVRKLRRPAPAEPGNIE